MPAQRVLSSKICFRIFIIMHGFEPNSTSVAVESSLQFYDINSLSLAWPDASAPPEELHYKKNNWFLVEAGEQVGDLDLCPYLIPCFP